MNVETAMNVARAGDRPVTEKYLTIAGSVATPVTLRVPLGVTLREMVYEIGGGVACLWDDRHRDLAIPAGKAHLTSKKGGGAGVMQLSKEAAHRP